MAVRTLRENLDAALAICGLSAGSTLLDTQRRLRVDAPAAMRLHSLKEAIAALLADPSPEPDGIYHTCHGNEHMPPGPCAACSAELKVEERLLYGDDET